ncbi:molybdopterin-dependent oxidoreductase [Mesorhizobium sp. BR1-1-16]|uniref:molybdopterin cofactor-binding domain-containing protein n=1 Tax=Mesorhizobium sp. BR1-1-16 TaxID=2876653 RepID=UPI001CCD46F8|nr:molybdopterin cofactor-binding domain-containing protein [Mesorhizobium sp. BR1-1-16]MBZ9936602.1 molybdopterin-dependent oxidoreductase [Mesorhizobium sp. BR1-1-16]
MRVATPTTIEDAANLLARSGSRAIAGGTLIQLGWARGESMPECLVDLSRLDLSGIDTASGTLRIGATARLAIIERDRRVADGWPLLAEAIRSVAAAPVRNLATIGGNIAGGVGCLWPALVALDASIDVITDGHFATLPILDWFTLPAGALLLAVLIGPVPADARVTVRKTGLRAAFTPSIIGVAAVAPIVSGVFNAPIIAAGGGITRPQRLRASERYLHGQASDAVDWSAFRAIAAHEIETQSDAFRSARYRKAVAANALAAGLGGTTSLPAGRPSRLRQPTQPGGTHQSIAVSRENLAGRWGVRPDIAAKVAGRLIYLTDRRSDDMLVGRILRAGIPHGLIRTIDTSAAEALPGVVAVVTAADIKGINAFGIVEPEQPALCFDRVRHAGDPVAAVAAGDAETAARALALICVDYETLPLVGSFEAAMAADAPALHPGGNLRLELNHRRGDIDAAFARAAHIVEDIYETPRQMHGFMETEGGAVIPEADGSLTVAVGGQHGSRDRLQLSRILGMPEEKIRVITSPTGGAFGGKDELTVQPAMALLALKTGRPIRLQLDRAESVVAGIRRNPMTIRMKTACDADGILIAQSVDVTSECGAYASLSPAVLETALEHVAGPYRIDNITSRGRLAYTNNGICGAFRGFGANQMVFAIESQMNRLAQLAGLDPVEIRRRNLRVPGDPGFFGHPVAPTERLSEMLDQAALNPLWQAPRGRDDRGRLIGTGMALHHQGTGLGSLPPDPGGGRLTFRADGRIEAAFGLDEMGQGVMPAIEAAVSAALGCARADIVAVVGDTALAPESGSTTAARGTYVIWRTAQEAGRPFAAALLTLAARTLRRPAEQLALAPGGIRDAGSNSGALLMTFAELAASLDENERPGETVAFHFPTADYKDGNARYVFCFGAAVVRVAVDPVTGMVAVLDLDQHIAAGPIVDPAAYLGQIEGGGGQGLGFTLTEDALMRNGAYVTGNLDTYMLPSIRDAPQRMRVTALEDLDDGDPHGPRGVGEIGIGAVTPAIAAAIADAIGHYPAVTPIRPEEILDALARSGVHEGSQ